MEPQEGFGRSPQNGLYPDIDDSSNAGPSIEAPKKEGMIVDVDPLKKAFEESPLVSDVPVEALSRNPHLGEGDLGDILLLEQQHLGLHPQKPHKTDKLMQHSNNHQSL